MKTKTLATEAQVRSRLAVEGPFSLIVVSGERAWDPIAKRGWTRGAGRINYFAPASDGFVAAAFAKDDGKSGDYGRGTR